MPTFSNSILQSFL